MADYSLPPPKAFNFQKPEDWPKWKRRFEQFRSSSKLDDAAQSRQINTLLYCMGEKSEEVLASVTGTDDSSADPTYDSVIEKFERFFRVRKNVIFERARFNRRIQAPGESAEDYIMALYNLAEDCEYGQMKSEMIRDRLVVGIRDTNLSERLQLDPQLTLETAKKAVRQREAVKEQQKELSTANTVVSTVRASTRRQTSARRSQPDRVKNISKQTQSRRQKCTRCGKEPHKRDSCPARDATCHRCQRRGHYGSQCLSKTVAEITSQLEESADVEDELEEDSDAAFLDAITDELPTKENYWKSTINLNGKMEEFKIDTGAEVTAISEEVYVRVGKPKLQPPSKLLNGPAEHSLEVLGEFMGQLKHKHKSVRNPIFVVKGLKTSLLGLPAITSLKLACRLNRIEHTDWFSEYPKVFNGLGTLGEPYQIKLKSESKPHAIFSPRQVPLAYRSKIKEELQRMESLGVISRVEEPTPWCSGMVAVPKKNGAIRICVDLRPLNQSVCREVYPLPKVDDLLGQMTNAKVFSKIDANAGFWQIPLSQESRLFTTFLTPMGRYCFNKLPFGITSAPELFQRRMTKLLDGLEGCLCLIDDVLIFGKNQDEHNTRLKAVLDRLQEKNVTLNPKKCEFSKKSVTFLGHVLDENGVHPDPEKTRAIEQMKAPRNITEVRRFLGIVNQLGKFSHKLAEFSQPLRELLKKKNTWIWGHQQDSAFTNLKREISKGVVLGLYDLKAETKIATDASSYGLGAALLQRHTPTSEWRPISFASRSLTETERRYAQIEKEALAITWACEKFSAYLLGKSFLVYTDHKPLIPLLGSKQLDCLPPRILRFRLRLNRFEYSIEHTPGKTLYIPDALSRAPLPMSTESDTQLQEDAEELMEVAITNLPAGSNNLAKYSEEQRKDPVCLTLIQYCEQGWPQRKTQLSSAMEPYWEHRGRLTIGKELLLYDHRIVVPNCMQKETLEKIHAGHQGIEKCRSRARRAVWWPGLSKEIAQKVKDCAECSKDFVQRSEPLMPTKLPKYPWQQVGTDLFTYKGREYLLTVDYFSRYPEIARVPSTTSQGIILALKKVFSRHGIPEVVRSDNGPQYSSTEFAEFASSYGFVHVTSSPHFPQSNGCAERTIQTVKKMLLKSEDPFLALLAFRSTPLSWCHLSPAELSMGRALRSNLPQVTEKLIPKWDYLPEFRKCDEEFKEKQKKDFDHHHRARPLPPIPNDTPVWFDSNGKKNSGQVVSQTSMPRSYIVQTDTGQFRRNRCHLNQAPTSSQVIGSNQPENNQVMTRSRTGTTIQPPDRLSPSFK